MKTNLLKTITAVGRVFAAALALGLTGGVSARAATLNVPAQYPTIQAAVTAAAAGDTVLVANGTYTGTGNHDIDFGGKDLTVKSSGGAANCIIDCQSAGCGFYLHSGETAASRIEGFTVKNGYGNSAGGAMRFGGGSTINLNPVAANCVFTGNKADTGGAVYGGTAINCAFTGNTSARGGGMSGGNAVNCAFTGNRAENAAGLGYGGGMYTGTATNCAFTGNGAGSGGGGAFYTTALNCSFSGGGMAGGTATNCLFTGNSADPFGALQYVTSIHCTVVGGGSVSGSTLFNCIVWNTSMDRSTASYSDVQGGAVGTGNINVNPLFVNASAGDYHLQTASPCIDAGTTTLPSAPTTDFAGGPRWLGSAPDMGIYESTTSRPHASLAGAALLFNSAATVAIPHADALNAFPFTAEMWINTAQAAGDAPLISKGGINGSSGWRMTLHNGLLAAAYFRDSANAVSDGGAYTFTGGQVADGLWHHVAFTVDSAGGKLYVDGLIRNSLAWSGTPGPTTNAQNVTLGAFAGYMDEVRLWSRARTAPQISVNARATQRENEAGLLAYYRFDEGKGTVTADAAANHFDGALNGSPAWKASDAPVDTVIVTNGVPRAFRAAGFDVNGTALTFAKASSPAYGTLAVNSPILTYTPSSAGGSMTDSFTYTASNGAATSSPAVARILYRADGGAILNVPAQYATIQAAVDAAFVGDTVLVANGTYTGAGNYNIDFGGKDLTVKSSGGAANCIIDCQGNLQVSAHGFYLHSGETAASRIEGFTIKNGFASYITNNNPNGGGIYIADTNPVVANCVLTGNVSVTGGGGMYGGTAINCVFQGNTIPIPLAGSGAHNGGGMSNGVAIHCVFFGNSAYGDGGGMYGGTAVNCIFWSNTVGFFQFPTLNSVSGAAVTYSDVQGSAAGAGNINADPLFVNAAAGDFHLTAASPCINAGTATALPSGVTLPTTDFDGRPRVIGSAPDMGAYEYGTAAPVAVSGLVALEGVPDLNYVVSAACHGIFHAAFRVPGTKTVVYGADFGLLITSVKDQGRFTIPGVPPGVYDVTLQGWKNLRVLLPNVSIYAPLTLPLVTLPGGDANGDNHIDSSDFGVLIGAFNTDSSIPGGGYDGNADFNYDGVVDSSDFGLLIGNYGSVGDL